MIVVISIIIVIRMMKLTITILANGNSANDLWNLAVNNENTATSSLVRERKHSIRAPLP